MLRNGATATDVATRAGVDGHWARHPSIRRYLGRGVLTRSRLTLVKEHQTEPEQEAVTPALTS